MDEARQEVVFHTEDQPDLLLALGAPLGGWRADFDVVPVRVQGGGLTCSLNYLTYCGDGLDGFFAELVHDWRGWQGVREWNAIENGMSIQATHTGRRVELVFLLRSDPAAQSWQLRLRFLIAPGESLDRLAREIHALLAGP